VMLGICVCVHRATTSRTVCRINLRGESNVLYPVLSRFYFVGCFAYCCSTVLSCLHDLLVL